MFFFSSSDFLKHLDPDQARHYVGPDLGPNCLQRLRVKNKCNKDAMLKLLNYSLFVIFIAVVFQQMSGDFINQIWMSNLP